MGSIYTDMLVHSFKTDKCVINQEGLLTKKNEINFKYNARRFKLQLFDLILIQDNNEYRNASLTS